MKIKKSIKCALFLGLVLILIPFTISIMKTETQNANISIRPIDSDPGDIVVTSPSSSSNWGRKIGHSITWTSPGYAGMYVSINISYTSGVYKMIEIKDQTDNDGSWNWNIPHDFDEASSYSILVIAYGSPSTFGASGSFNIYPIQTVNITNPIDTTIWETESDQYIVWTRDNGGTLNIELYKDDIFNQTIATDISGTWYLWTIPGDLIASEKYTIKVIDYEYGLEYNISDTFEITLKDKFSPIINITSPVDDQEIGRAPPSFNVIINEPNLNASWYSLNGGQNKTFTTNSTINQTMWETLWDALNHTDEINITFYANDTNGNEGSSQVTVKKYDPPEDDDNNGDDNGDDNKDSPETDLDLIIPGALLIGAISGAAIIVVVAKKVSKPSRG